MYRKALVVSIVTLAALATAVSHGRAQVVEPGNFDVGVGGGVMFHPNHSAIVSSSPFINMHSTIFITENFGLGFALDYSRTETDDDIFPLAQFQFPTADSTIFVAMRQPMALFHYQFTAAAGLPIGNSLYGYLTGGIGGYTIYLDPQQNEAPDSHSDLSLSIGAAMKFRVAGSSAIEIGVRDFIYTGFERDVLNPTFDRACREGSENRYAGRFCPNERYPLLNPEYSSADWSEAQSTVHNIVVTAAFTFVPRL
jgi:hypothetical protein